MPKSITLGLIDGKPGRPGQVYYPLVLHNVMEPTPQKNELLIRLSAASLNHRDLFCRQHLYPGVAFDVPLLSDGVGTVIATGPDVKNPEQWKGKRVIINPGIGWRDSPDGPESGAYMIMGGTKFNNKGALQDFVTIDESEVEEAPAHLSDAEAAALPLTGLTAWRALVYKAGKRNSGNGATVLITGIGGGVALMALRFAVAMGAHVYVTSSSEEKIKKAIGLGASGGVSYKEEGWEKKLLDMIPADAFDAIIDGAGGDIVEKATKLLKVNWFYVVKSYYSTKKIKKKFRCVFH